MAEFKRRPVRQSQVISTFGPGSIIDLPNESVMMLGIDKWKSSGGDIPENEKLHEHNLQRLLGKEYFRKPPVSDDRGNDIPCVLFPEWMVCPKCNRLAHYSYFAGGALYDGRKRITCQRCNVNVHPARLIVSCKNGHIDDFPWELWAHHGKKCDKRAELVLFSSGKSATLSDLVVYCRACESGRNLSGATQKANLSFIQCSGRRPWLLDDVECTEEVVPLQRGASNVYFPILKSAISIPPWSEDTSQKLEKYWDMLKHVPDPALKETLEGMELPVRLNLTISKLIAAIKKRRSREEKEQSDIDEDQIRKMECHALRNGKSDTSSGDFEARKLVINGELEGFISCIVKVVRLREVRTLTGFSRVQPPNPNSDSNGNTANSFLSRNPLQWYPAINNHGEGLYFELDSEAVSRWEKSKFIVDRIDKLNEKYIEICNKRGWEPNRVISPRFILTHSLSHLIIQQLGLEAGYSSASIRERIYVFSEDEIGVKNGVAGVLLYTSTSDADGSLGGLSRQAEVAKFSSTLKLAIQNSSWCSSDPLCIESENQGHDGLNLAACHACLLISETSCEEYNRFLDRGTITGVIDKPETGFFSRLL